MTDEEIPCLEESRLKGRVKVALPRTTWEYERRLRWRVKVNRILGSLLWGFLFLTLWAGLTHAQGEKELAPVIEVETPIHNFDQVLQGEVVTHDFRVFNRGNAELKIQHVSPD